MNVADRLGHAVFDRSNVLEYQPLSITHRNDGVANLFDVLEFSNGAERVDCPSLYQLSGRHLDVLLLQFTGNGIDAQIVAAHLLVTDIDVDLSLVAAGRFTGS